MIVRRKIFVSHGHGASGTNCSARRGETMLSAYLRRTNARKEILEREAVIFSIPPIKAEANENVKTLCARPLSTRNCVQRVSTSDRISTSGLRLPRLTMPLMS